MSVAIALQDCHSGLPFQLRFGRSQKGSRNVQKEKQNDDIFSNEPGIFFLEQTFVGRWFANRAARDDGFVANNVFRISVGGGSLEEELEDLFSKENR